VPTREYFRGENVLERMNKAKRVSFWPEYAQQTVTLARDTMPLTMVTALAHTLPPPPLHCADPMPASCHVCLFTHLVLPPSVG